MLHVLYSPSLSSVCSESVRARPPPCARHSCQISLSSQADSERVQTSGPTCTRTRTRAHRQTEESNELSLCSPRLGVSLRFSVRVWRSDLSAA